MNATKERFLKSGAKEVRRFAPTPMMNVGKGAKPGSFVAGQFKEIRENGKSGKGRRAFITLILEDTNVDASIKKDDRYVNITPEKNKQVSVLATARLERAMQNVPAGSSVYIEYQGQDGEAEGNPHLYEVLVKKAEVVEDPEANEDEGF